LTRASLSPNSSAAASAFTLDCGPLRVDVRGESGPLLDLIYKTLDLYDVPWQIGPLKEVALDVAITPFAGPTASGTFIEAARMHVDPAPDGLRATTDGGTVLVGCFTPESERWSMSVDPAVVESGSWFDVEDLLTLVLTTGWRRAGWVPLHAGGLVPPSGEGGVLVCATSGGGKTTFTVAMARRGWRSLGDDKLLLRAAPDTSTVDAEPLVASIKQMLNISPSAAAWFPELAGIADEPRYSASVDKRRVSLGRLWPHAPIFSMRPTHLVVVARRTGGGSLDITPMTRAESISALLHQTVIPRDPAVARPITAAVAGLAEGLTALRIETYEDTYGMPDSLDAAERALT